MQHLIERSSGLEKMLSEYVKSRGWQTPLGRNVPAPVAVSRNTRNAAAHKTGIL